MNKHEEYGEQVRLLLRIMPLVYKIKDFAVHGGTAINLFHRNMPRYSVDIDVTYIPIAGREESLNVINRHLTELKRAIETSIRILLKQLTPLKRKNTTFFEGVSVHERGILAFCLVDFVG